MKHMITIKKPLLLSLILLSGCTSTISNTKQKTTNINSLNSSYKTPFELLTIYNTENYKITVYNGCEEGNVTCDNVKFEVLNFKNNKLKVAIGSTWHLPCGEEKICKFYGYEFQLDGTHYQINEIDNYFTIDSVEEPVISTN